MFPSLSEKYELHRRQKDREDGGFQKDRFLLSTPLANRERVSKGANPHVAPKSYGGKKSPYLYPHKAPASDSAEAIRPKGHVAEAIRGNGRSPIKRLPFTPSRLRPNKLYKVIDENTPNSTYRLFSRAGIPQGKRGGAKYAPKSGRTVHSLVPLKQGVFSRLRAFLTSFGVKNFSGEASDMNQWEKSAREILSSSSGSKRLRNGGKRVVFDEDANSTIPSIRSSKKPSTYNYEDDIDAVDDAMRKTEILRTEALLWDQIQALRKKLEEEAALRRLSEEQHQCEIKEVTESYETRIATFREKIALLEKRASSRMNDLERSKVEELEKALLRKHEKHLIKQKETEEHLQVWENRLQIQAEEISERSQLLDQKTAKLLDFRSKADDIGSKYTDERARLEKQRHSIDSRIKGNKNDTIRFYEDIQKLSETLLQKRARLSAVEMRFLEDLHGVLVMIGKLDENSNRSKAVHEYAPFESKLAEYERYFGDFELQKTNGYSLKRLYGVEEAFKKLRLHLQKKLSKKEAVLSEVSDTVSRVQRKLEMGALVYESGVNMETLMGSFQRKSGLLFELQALNQLLFQLNDLFKHLKLIMAKVEAGNTNN